jgi:carboxylesterase type B
LVTGSLLLHKNDIELISAVKELRLRPPQPAIWNTTTYSATKQPQACLQDPKGMSGAYGAFGVSEDCLYLNVFSPAGANAQTAFLPVMVWM